MYLLGTLLETCEIRSGTQTQQTYTHRQKQQLHRPICFQKTSNKLWGCQVKLTRLNNNPKSHNYCIPLEKNQNLLNVGTKIEFWIILGYLCHTVNFRKNNHIGLRNTQREPLSPPWQPGPPTFAADLRSGARSRRSASRCAKRSSRWRRSSCSSRHVIFRAPAFTLCWVIL